MYVCMWVASLCMYSSLWCLNLIINGGVFFSSASVMCVPMSLSFYRHLSISFSPFVFIFCQNQYADVRLWNLGLVFVH